MSGPIDCTLYVTGRCNLKCRACFRQAQDVPSRDMDIARVHAVLARFPTLKNVCMAGFGEPLLHPDLIALCTTVARAGKQLSLITNGTLLSRWSAQLGTLPFTYINVSINAATASEHSAYNGTDTWLDVLAGVRMLREQRQPVMISFVISQRNIGSIRDYLSLAHVLGDVPVVLHSVLPHLPAWTASALVRFREEEALTDADARTVTALAIVRGHVHARLVRSWPTLLTATCPGLCQSPFVSVGVDPAGFVTPCRRIFPPDARFGHMDDLDLWNGAGYTRTRAAVALHDTWIPTCLYCQGNWRG